MTHSATNAGSKLVAAAEAGWEHIRKLNPEVGEAIIVIGSGGRRAPRLLGHFIADKWEVDGSKVHEVLLVGENLKRTGTEVFTTLLHESVHALAHSRNLKDVSGQRHNKRFAKLCLEMGLVPPQKPDSVLGYSAATLDDMSKFQYVSDITRIEEALKLCRLMELVPKAEPTSFKAICPCDRSLRLSKKQINEGPIVCGLCQETFQLEEEF